MTEMMKQQKIKVLSLDEESEQFSYALDGQEGVDASGCYG